MRSREHKTDSVPTPPPRGAAPPLHRGAVRKGAISLLWGDFVASDAASASRPDQSIAGITAIATPIAVRITTTATARYRSSIASTRA